MVQVKINMADENQKLQRLKMCDMFYKVLVKFIPIPALTDLNILIVHVLITNDHVMRIFMNTEEGCCNMLTATS